MDQPRSALKLRQLEYFLAVARTRHFSNAAAALFVTQPTLSHQIAELEAQLGTPLFNRNGKSISLTEAGDVFRIYAARALAELTAGRTALDELAGLERGTLRIGVTQSFVRHLLPPILGEFATAYPAITLTATELTAGEIEHALAEDELDIGIGFAPATLEETELEPMVEERLVLVAKSGHPLFADRNQVSASELHAQPMALMSKKFFTRQLIDTYLREAGTRPRVVCETNSIGVLIGIAEQSDVLAIVPEGAVYPSANLAILRIVNPSPVRTCALLWSRHSFRTQAATAFASAVRRRVDMLL